MHSLEPTEYAHRHLGLDYRFKVFGLLLGGSWAVIIGRVVSRITILITPIRGPITPHITTHEPPGLGFTGLSRLLMLAGRCAALLQGCFS